MKKKHILFVTLGVALALILTVGALLWPKVRSYFGHPKEALPVLMYHHIVPDGAECNSVTVTEPKLRSDFRYLIDNGYTPVLPRELAAGNPLPEKPVVITFDDGYTSNYELLFPLAKEMGIKVEINAIVALTDEGHPNFCTWDMYREMNDSGLVEIGSHTYRLHNLDGRGGLCSKDLPNGIQRLSNEDDESFRRRVLGDIKKSYDRFEEELGRPPVTFAFPFGVTEPDAEDFINNLFPVTLVTGGRLADLSLGLHGLKRLGINMETELSEVLP